MEPLYSLKIAGFTISAAYELVHGYYDSMYGAYVFMEAYTETGYAENFVKLMNTLVKRKGNVRIDIKEYDDYLRMRKELPKQALYDYPIVISRKKNTPLSSAYRKYHKLFAFRKAKKNFGKIRKKLSKIYGKS